MGPLKFTPLLKRLRWGGRRLGEILGKQIGTEADYAESWEVCDHGADQTLVATWEFAGWPLRRLVAERSAELLGRHADLPQFPLLIKFLDAHDRLSLQVHPDDARARLGTPGVAARGKSEAWVILAAEPGSCVFAGLKSGVTSELLRQAIDKGSVEDCLHRIAVSAGDCFYIPAGTVHAIGEGILLAEVQQSSDLTFRLFDWNRVGAEGKPRTLHIEEALACIDFERGPVDPSGAAALPGAAAGSERLVACPYFTIHRHSLARPLSIPHDDRCRILIALEGSAECLAGGQRASLRRGETLLIPASALPATVTPQPRSVTLEVFW